jgi:hypothetical protein
MLLDASRTEQRGEGSTEMGHLGRWEAIRILSSTIVVLSIHWVSPNNLPDTYR